MAYREYYLASDAYAYPSSNANDGGDDNSELNLKTITDKFSIKGFVVRRPGKYENYFRFSKSPDTSTSLDVTGGECSINGYYFFLEDTVLDLSKYLKDFPKGETYCNLLVRIYKDGSENLRGDGLSIDSSSSHYNQRECRGVALTILNDEELSALKESNPNDILVLGKFKVISGKLSDNPDDYVPSSDRFSFIDSETVLTPDGKKLEDWVLETINYYLSRLSQLNYYKEGDDHSSASLSVTDTTLVYQSGDITFDIVEINNRTHVSESGQMTTPSTSTPSTVVGVTYNGVSNLLSRSDHNHDSRYLTLTGPSQSVTQIPDFSEGVKVNLINFNKDGGADFNQNTVITGEGHLYNKKGITTDGEVHAAKVFNAVWNDLAEGFRMDDPSKLVPPGTLIAKVRGKDTYAPATKHNDRLVVGVVSDSYGILLGGEKGMTEKEILSEYYPIALVGRVRVRVKQGIRIDEGDPLAVSDEEGLAEPNYFGDFTTVGKALESSEGDKERVLMQVMLM